ncbi:MAG: 3D domain-containing protein [Clostridium sp.]
MKTRLRHGLSVAAISVFCMLTGAFSAFAANVAGNVDSVTNSTISGWAIDKDCPDKSAEVVLYVYADGATTAKELAKVKADQYRSDLEKNQGNGNHAFSYTVNWDELTGNTFLIQAYVISGDKPILLNSTPQYSKSGAYAGPATDAAVAAEISDQAGPNQTENKQQESVQPTPTAAAPITSTSTAAAPVKATSGKRGASLGNFVTTAYCNCTRCSSGHNLTYSGTVPKAKHTISADIDYYPIGTQLMIGDTIYTVEDIGTGVDGKILDIYFDTHQQALNYGMKTVEVFSVK